MMEGVASEAASLAGHLGLDSLCWIWDNNHITIEGNTSIAFTEDVAARFLAYGWNVLTQTLQANAYVYAASRIFISLRASC
jgi:transketolase